MKKPVVKGIIFLAILMLLANVMACSSGTPTNESKPAATSTPASQTPAKDEIKPTQANIDATKDWQTYENATHKLTVKYPKDWTKKEDSNVIIGFMSGGTANVNLVSEDLAKAGSPNLKVDEYLKLSLPNIEKEFKDFKLLENTPLTMGNVKAQKIVYTANMEGMNLKFMQVLTVINQKAYVLTYTALADEYDKNLETANKIFGSLAIQ